jgi:hypothetical protein
VQRSTTSLFQRGWHGMKAIGKRLLLGSYANERRAPTARHGNLSGPLVSVLTSLPIGLASAVGNFLGLVIRFPRRLVSGLQQY